MRESDSQDDWKDELGRAVARFIINVAAIIPLIAAAAAVGVFLHSLFSEPFGFTCRSVAGNPAAVKRKAQIVRKIPVTPAAENEGPMIQNLPDKAE